MHPLITRIGPRTALLFLTTVSVFIVLTRVGGISFSTAAAFTHKSAFIFALLVTIPFPILSALRWKYTVNGLGIPLTFRRAFEIIMGTWLLSVLPGRLGDFARPLALPRDTPAEIGVGSILFEKVIDILVLTAMSMIGFLLIASLRNAGIVTVVIVGMLVLLKHAHRIIPFAPVRFQQKIRSLAIAASRLTHSPAAIGRVIAASTLNWLLSLAQVFFLFQAMGTVVPFASILAYVPLTIFVGLIPVTFAGMGTRDSALVVLFTGLATPTQSLGVGIWYSLLGYWLFALLGIPYLIGIIRKIPFSKNTGPTPASHPMV